MTGAELIAAERRRQIAAEGHTSGRDDAHKPGTLTCAAICYASVAGSGPNVREVVRSQSAAGHAPRGWPWDRESWKPGSDDSAAARVHELVKAGALLAAEIDRINRKARSTN